MELMHILLKKSILNILNLNLEIIASILQKLESQEIKNLKRII